MKQITLKRFGESKEPPLIQWYELTNGKRIICEEKTIDTLWKVWVCSKYAIRSDDKEFVIFDLKEPIKVDIE